MVETPGAGIWMLVGSGKTYFSVGTVSVSPGFVRDVGCAVAGSIVVVVTGSGMGGDTAFSIGGGTTFSIGGGTTGVIGTSGLTLFPVFVGRKFKSVCNGNIGLAGSAEFNGGAGGATFVGGVITGFSGSSTRGTIGVVGTGVGTVVVGIGMTGAGVGSVAPGIGIGSMLPGTAGTGTGLNSGTAGVVGSVVGGSPSTGRVGMVTIGTWIFAPAGITVSGRLGIGTAGNLLEAGTTGSAGGSKREADVARTQGTTGSAFTDGLFGCDPGSGCALANPYQLPAASVPPSTANDAAFHHRCRIPYMGRSR